MRPIKRFSPSTRTRCKIFESVSGLLRLLSRLDFVPLSASGRVVEPGAWVSYHKDLAENARPLVGGFLSKLLTLGMWLWTNLLGHLTTQECDDITAKRFPEIRACQGNLLA